MTINFISPPAAYRGAPLWVWNTRLSWPELKTQIDQLEEMGMGGFTIHSRVGLDTAYLGTEFMTLVKKSVEYAKEKGMLACLYDEDRWPSGSAGGLAVKDHPEYRAQHILITPFPYGKSKKGLSSRASAKATRSENGSLVGRIELEEKQDGLVAYRFLRPNSRDPLSSDTRYVYVETNPPSEWFNGETYIDTLNPKAIKAFIHSTHDVYRETVGTDFGTTVPTIFTDEPQFCHKSSLVSAMSKDDVFLPWTSDLEKTFSQTFGVDLLQRLAEVVWDVEGDEGERRRWEYHDHVCERFVVAFMDQIATWCKNSGIKFTGHMMNEPTLLSQTMALGEAMRCYRNMDIPGVDMLCERIELNTVKQASSVARQNRGKEAWCVSEIYGVTGWTMTFAKHKLLGDWQAALGINWRVHHLSPVSLVGESKRDYPAAIGYQSPWYKEYKHVEDHFARVNLALTTGSALTRVAVIHPIESFWLCAGPVERDGAQMSGRDIMFRELTDWLLYGLIDFDFVAESLLPSQVGTISKTLQVGFCEYDVVILPNLRTIRRSTLDILDRFAASGGEVIVLGSVPTMMDARPSQFDIPGKQVPLIRHELLALLEPRREVSISDLDGFQTKTLLHQLRRVGDERYLFISNLSESEGVNGKIKVRGHFDVEVIDTWTGKTSTLVSTVDSTWTRFDWRFDGCGSLLVHLVPRTGVTGTKQINYRNDWKHFSPLKLDKVTLSEPNVLLLDFAEFKVDDGPWEAATEVLRIDNQLRSRFGLPLKGEAAAQLWTIPSESRRPQCQLGLRFRFTVAVAITAPVELALELSPGQSIVLDDSPISVEPTGWWVDKGISRISLASGLSVGEHALELSAPFGRISNVERVYILGDFRVDFPSLQLSPLGLGDITWGDWVYQGLPFYAGNVTYHSTLEVPDGSHVALEGRQVKGPVVVVERNEVRCVLAGPPYVADLGEVVGRQNVRITCFGDRENAFGAIHLPPGKTWWRSPNEWRTQHTEWQDEYNLVPMGLMVAPHIKIPGEDVYIAPFLNRDRPVHNPIGRPILPPRGD